jgi:licheninase
MKLTASHSILGSALALSLLLSACKSDKNDDSSTSKGGQGGEQSSVGGNGAAGESSGGSSSGGSSSGGTSVGGSGTGGSSGGSTGELVIDDFEDGDDKALISGSWYSYTDKGDGGGSTLAFTGATGSAISMGGEGFQSNRSLAIEYTFDKGTLKYDPFVGVGVSLASATAPLDWSAYTTLAFAYQGGAHTVRIETSDVKDYDYFGVALPAKSNWSATTLPFSLLKQEGWGTKVTFDPKHITAISFHVRGATGASAKLLVDNLKVTAESANTGPDMTVQPATPPADGVIPSIEITNPLQAKAMAYLTRGYNITNWLEQGKFKAFTYDETYVQNLAKAGFKSLRLPIDLDLYIDNTTGTGDSLDVSVESTLFTILDSFDTWTKANGLSLTIDYHQYDKSLNLTDPVSVAKAVKVWGKVAEHFAASTREDLFYELLNEPELSMDGTAPTAAQWTTLANQMISEIRTYDKNRTIIFGDVQWYGIAPLAKREPLADTNVIYAFHDYDPFIFTHQGASWANMGSTHDLPYPYAPERWSEYFADLGFNPYMESWILSAAKNYYKTGNRSALRNTILDAKRWAVAHNVPVICNEFGAYDATSRLEDRARYYTDIVSIFDELQIPWQQWFMIMDAKGTVVPEYRTAMKLGQ